MMRRLAGIGCLLALQSQAASAQEYLLRVDSRLQTVTYRGVRLDSVAVGDTAAGAGGGAESPAGFAATCVPGRSFCSFYRPGDRRRGGPWTTTADLTAWGLGIEGLSLHGVGRIGLDLGSANAWPGSDPALQLLEGYAQYDRSQWTARLGRQVERGRLGYTGYDGGSAAWRLGTTGFAVSGLVGLGLARALAIPVTSDVVSPLDEFQPSRRQLVVGGAVEWTHAPLEARLEYLREVDRETRFFVSERAALSATLRPWPGWSITGGTEYDFAYGWWGSSDLTLRHAQRAFGGALGIRRHRPYFDLWTIWGAFSPVPYSAVNASAWVAPVPRLKLRAAVERYDYDDADASAPLVVTEDHGSRWSLGAAFDLSRTLTLDGTYRDEIGPGASSRGWEASALWSPRPFLTLSANGGLLTRPLELRFDNARLGWIGASGDAVIDSHLRAGIALTRYMEDRRRPDAASFDWNQTRLRLSLTWLYGSRQPDVLPLPPGRRMGSL
jgi:hypothetical protein